jgi:hypothetical protein
MGFGCLIGGGCVLGAEFALEAGRVLGAEGYFIMVLGGSGNEPQAALVVEQIPAPCIFKRDHYLID